MVKSLKTRLLRLEKDCRPPKPPAVAIRYEDESQEEAVQRFRVETGYEPEMVIHYWRKRPAAESDASQGGIAMGGQRNP